MCKCVSVCESVCVSLRVCVSLCSVYVCVFVCLCARSFDCPLSWLHMAALLSKWLMAVCLPQFIRTLVCIVLCLRGWLSLFLGGFVYSSFDVICFRSLSLSLGWHACVYPRLSSIGNNTQKRSRSLLACFVRCTIYGWSEWMKHGYLSAD